MHCGQRGLHSVTLVSVVLLTRFGLLQRVDPGQDLLLHVIYLVLEQVLQTVGLHRAVVSAVLLFTGQEGQTDTKGEGRTEEASWAIQRGRSIWVHLQSRVP